MRIGCYEFRPRFWVSLVVVICITILIMLGNWQWRRLAWKEGLLADIEEGMSSEPVLLPEIVEDASKWDYHPVFVQGEFLHEDEIMFHSRVYEGQAGYHLYVPFRRDFGDIIWVNRGWLPYDYDDELVDRPVGRVGLAGILRFRPSENHHGKLDNEPENDEWIWPDMEAMSAHVGIGDLELLPLFLDMVNPDTSPEGVVGSGYDSKGYPIAGVTLVSYPNNHLQYMFTWYGFAFILLIIYIIYSTRRVDDDIFKKRKD